MTFPSNPQERSPKGDHNRRLSLGLDSDEFAATAGVSTDDLRAYEFTDVDGTYDLDVAERVGRALERLEANIEPKVANGDQPQSDTIEGRVTMALRSRAFAEKLALADAGFAEQLVSSQLAAIDPSIQLVSTGERARGPVREILVTWREGNSGAVHEEVISVPPHSVA
jgi:hypothetical protein